MNIITLVRRKPKGSSTYEWLKKGVYKFFVEFIDKCSTDQMNSRVNSDDNRAQLNLGGNQR